MPATLTVTRETDHLMELRRGTFEIVLDDAAVGSIERNGRFEAPIEPGRHTLRIRAGRYSSQTESFVVGDGDAFSFRCNGARIWPVYIASLLKPDLALVLKPE